MPTQETGKSRAQRIQLDYYRQTDTLATFRRVSIWVAAAGAALFSAYALIPAGSPLLNTGPLSSVHASFEADCQKCHGPFVTSAVAADAWRWDRQASLDHLEQACQDCHPVSSHFRALLVDPGRDQDCSRCHREHQGRAHDLTRVADRSCQDCHAALSRAVISSHSPRIRTEIDAFTRSSHGDFASLQADPGEIGFDHAQHMQPGQVRPGDRGGMRLEWLEPSWRAIYRKPGQGDDALVELTCHDCHQPAAAPRAGVPPGFVHGRSHQPIQFDEHCAGCHELNYLRRNGEQLPLPHAAPWSEVRALMAAKVQGGALTGQIAPPFESGPRERIPGETSDRDRATNLATDDETMAWALASVRERCKLCHASAHLEDDFIAGARAQRGSALIPSRWLQRGMFDHAAHAQMDCRFCHPIPASDEVSPLRGDETVMIRGIASCTGCHRSETAPTPAELTTDDARALLQDQPTWASDRCVLCHRYHWTRPVDK